MAFPAIDDNVMGSSMIAILGELRALEILLKKGEVDMVIEGIKEVADGLELTLTSEVAFCSDEYRYLEEARRECDGN